MYWSLSLHFQKTEKWKIFLRFTVILPSKGFLQRIHMLQLYLKLEILSFPAWSIIRPLALPENTCSRLCKGLSQQLVELWRTSAFFAAGAFSPFPCFRPTAGFHSSPFSGFQVTFWGWKHNVSEDNYSFLLC